MRLSDAVATAVADQHAPAAVLALTYAEQIEAATHVKLGHAAALREIEAAVAAAAELDPAAYVGALDALAKIAAALSAVTVASDLGPKLLMALDALLLTPKAKAAVGQLLPAKPAGNPLDALRAEEDELARQRAKRAG